MYSIDIYTLIRYNRFRENILLSEVIFMRIKL